MKNWRLLMLAAAVALSLQACDVQVHSGSTKVQQPQASLPEDTQLQGQATPVAPAAVDTPVAEAPVPAPAEPAVQPVPEMTAQAAPEPAPMATPVPDTTAQAPVQPDTAALGAAGMLPDTAVPATTGVAAPTELQRFFETNSPAAKAEAKAAKAAATR